MDKNTKLSSKEIALSLKVGDSVTTEYYPADRNVIRTITKIENDADTGSTVRIWASEGGVCECCNKARSKPVPGVDGGWFFPA